MERGYIARIKFLDLAKKKSVNGTKSRQNCQNLAQLTFNQSIILCFILTILTAISTVLDI